MKQWNTLYCTMNDMTFWMIPFHHFSPLQLLLCESVLTLIPKAIRMGYVATTTKNDNISNLQKKLDLAQF